METYLEFFVRHSGQRTEPRDFIFNERVPSPPHMRWRVSTPLQPAGRCCGSWGWSGCSADAPCSAAGLWFGSINFWHLQYAPQLGRDGAAYYRGEFISLFGCGSRGLFATQLLDPLVDGRRRRRARRFRDTRALQGGMDVGGFGLRI